MAGGEVKYDEMVVKSMAYALDDRIIDARGAVLSPSPYPCQKETPSNTKSEFHTHINITGWQNVSLV